LTDVLTKLVNRWPASRIEELMPWAWAAPPRLSALKYPPEPVRRWGGCTAYEVLRPVGHRLMPRI